MAKRACLESIYGLQASFGCAARWFDLHRGGEERPGGPQDGSLGLLRGRHAGVWRQGVEPRGRPWKQRSAGPQEVDPRWEQAAAGITETCYEMYRRQPTHLAPEATRFNPQQAEGQDMCPGSKTREWNRWRSRGTGLKTLKIIGNPLKTIQKHVNNREHMKTYENTWSIWSVFSLAHSV